ncbi:MAG: hypothetical protein IH898_00485 [Planctomycetes bacterium]|nr:hypothetical protein [Planctomycetota bacterium]
MPRWLLGWKCAIVGQIALVLLASAAITPQDSWSAERELRWVSPSRISTLDAYVPPQTQTFQFDSTLIDNINLGVATKRDSKVKHEVAKRKVATRFKSSWRQVGPPPSRTASKPTPPAQSQPKADDKASPFGKWLTPEDVDVNGALAADESSTSIATDNPTKKITPTDNSPKKVTASAESLGGVKKDEVERIARRFRRRDVQQTPQRYVPQETMHPTERQKDDRKRPAEPPVENLPDPDRDESEETSSTAPEDFPPLSQGQLRLRTKIRRVLAHYYNRPLSTHNRSPWEVMHSMLAFEVHSKVLRGGSRGEPITAVGWLCFNQPCKRRTLMYVNDDGELRVRVGPALQGHRGQLLAMLAQSKVMRDYPMRVEGHDLTVADLIEMEKGTCYPRSELTFKLIGLMHYLPSDSQWVNDQGMEWDLSKLVSEELRQPIRGAACGGTHRLTGLTLAYKKREQRGEPVDGEYLRAQRFVAKYQRYAYRMQNRDGSFSTDWFKGPGNEEDVERRLKTTGHILEWLLYAATEKELKNSRTTRAANYLANIMYNNRNKDWEAGPLGHAIHALLLYNRLVFSRYESPDKGPLAGRTQSSASARSRR